MDDDTEKTEEEIAFDAIPPEVKTYIYSTDFDSKLTSLFSDLKIDEEKQTLLKGALFGFIAQIQDEDELVARINDTVADPAQQEKIKQWVTTNVSQPILVLIRDAYLLEKDSEEDEGEEEVKTTGTSSVSSKQVPSLSSLADRLKQASINNPVKSSDAGAIKDAAQSHAIDPYHEAIDNE